MPKDTRITIRLADDLRAKVEAACKITGLDEPTIVRACLEAFTDHVESEGGIWLPLAIVPKEQAAKKSQGAPAPVAPIARSTPPPSGSTHSLSEDPKPPANRTRRVMQQEALKHQPKTS